MIAADLMPFYVAGLTVFSTRAILEAHKAECAEDRARVREMFAELRTEHKEADVRLEKSVQEVSVRFGVEQAAHHADNQRRFDKLDDQVSKISLRVGVAFGVCAVFGSLIWWAAEHFIHLLPMG